MDLYKDEFEKIVRELKKYFSKLYIPEYNQIQTETDILFFKISNGIPIAKKDFTRYIALVSNEYDSMQKKFNAFSNKESKNFLKKAYDSSVKLGKQIISDFKSKVKEITMTETWQEKMIRIMKSDANNAFNNVSTLLTSIYRQSSQGLLSEMEMTYSISQAMINSGQREDAIQGLTSMFRNKKLGSEYDVSGIKEEKLITNKVKQFLSRNKNASTTEIANYVGKLKENGFIRIVGKDSKVRHYTTEYYSEMIVNQRLAETQIRATIDLGIANDVHIYEVTSHNSPNFCRVYEGTLHSDKYAGVDNIMGMDTIPTYHVNCKHRLMPSKYEVNK